MISRLPRWIWLGAWLLSFMAGFVNVVGFLGFQHQAVTHLTGTASMLAAAVADGDGAVAWRLALLIGSFVLGCVVSGAIVRDGTLKLGRSYGIVLSLEGVFLAAAVPLMDRSSFAGFCLAAGACGLQNAMVTTYSGAVVRTTHLSGLFTDLGIYLGYRLRGVSFDSRRLRLCVTIISAFICGGVAGTCCFRWLEYAALFFPAGLAGAAAAGYGLFALARRHAGARYD